MTINNKQGEKTDLNKRGDYQDTGENNQGGPNNQTSRKTQEQVVK